MRKILAFILAGILALGAVCTALAEGEPKVYAYDYSLRFHLNPSVYQFRDRQHVQGYADLLNMLEVRGTMIRCPETQSADVNVDFVPVTNQAAKVSVHMYGTADMMKLESSLLGQEVVCFRPSGLMAFAKRAWEAFKIPAPYYVLLVPDTTWRAFRCVPDMWNELIGPVKNGTTLSWDKVQELAEAWRVKLIGGDLPKNWVTAIGYPLENSETLQIAVEDLAKLIRLAANGKSLKFEEKKQKDGTRTLRLKNAAGAVLWEEHHTENSYDCTLSVPEIPVDYIPSWTYKTETIDGKINLSLVADWSRGPGTGEEDHAYRKEWPENLLSIRMEMNGLPATYPSDSAFSGTVSLSGYILPNFSYIVKGSTTAAGEISFSLTRADQEDGEPVFSITGSVVPKEYNAPLAYVTEEMTAEYNIFGLNEDTLYRLFHLIDRPLLSGMIDFLYELPASSCQSIMDDLETFGVIRTLLH